MNKNKKLIIDTFIYGIGSFGSKIISFLLLRLYTGYFTLEEYGAWDIFITTITLIVPFVSFEVLNAVYRWLLEAKSEEERREIISTGFFYTLRNMLVFNLLALIVLSIMDISFGVLAVILVNLTILNDFVQKCVRGCGYNKQFALTGAIQTFVVILSNLFFIYVLKFRLETFFYTSMISCIVGIIIGWFTLKFHRYLSIKKYSKITVKSFLKYSIPMIPGAINWWIMKASDRYIISLAMDPAANGLYAVSNKLPTKITLVNSVFFFAWQDNALRGYNDEDRDKYYTNVFKYYFRLMVTSCIVLILVNKIIVGMLVDVEFFEAWKYTGFLYISAVFSAFSSFWGAGFHGSKQTTAIFKTSLLGAIINIVVNVSLIRYIGLYAASLSTAIGFLVMWIIRVIDCKDTFKIKINKRDLIVLSTIMVISLPLSFSENTLINLISIMGSLLLFIVFNYDFVKKLINRVLNKKRGMNTMNCIKIK